MEDLRSRPTNQGSTLKVERAPWRSGVGSLRLIHGTERKTAPGEPGAVSKIIPGGDLLSHKVAPAVPSALRSLTAVFGMGTGVTFSLLPPEKLYLDQVPRGGSIPRKT